MISPVLPLLVYCMSFHDATTDRTIPRNVDDFDIELIYEIKNVN